MLRTITLIAIAMVALFAMACGQEDTPQQTAPQPTATVQQQATATSVPTVEPVAPAPTVQPVAPAPTLSPIAPVPQPTATQPEPETMAREYTPVFEETGCWFQLPDTQPVDCGYLIVPEERSNPNSPDIRLAVAILRHPGGSPEPDPIIRLHGGPGGGYLKFMALAYGEDASLFPANRDVIAFDQRGVGLSEPALECPNVGAAMTEAQDYEVDGEPLTVEGYQDYLASASAECFTELSKIANLSAYNSKESAADVNDLRIALGYDEVNIHASSYGTLLAQDTMRDFPEYIRSVILDASVLPHKIEDEVPAFQMALNVTFERCAADPACNSAFPNLRETWLDVVASLNENPQMIDASNSFTGEPFKVLLDGANATLPLRFMQASTGALGTIPLYIDSVSNGDYAIASQQWGGFVARVNGFASVGALLSVSCNTIRPLSSQEGIEVAISSTPELSDFFSRGPFFGITVLRMCENWDVEHATTEEMKPVKSAIPALIIRGDFDSATSLEESKLIAGNLENSFGPYDFTSMGHIVGLGKHKCPQGVEIEFINDPSSEPDTSCMSQMGGLEYALELGSREIELVAYTSSMFEGVVPAGWNELQPGMFARSNPEVDKTLLAQLAAPNAFADEMIGEVLGEFGLTELPDPIRTVPTDLLTWEVYYPAGLVPMFVAKAETDAATYLVVLVASQEELEELADTVLFPVISALTPAG